MLYVFIFLAPSRPPKTTCPPSVTPAPAPDILGKGPSLLYMPCGSRISDLTQNPTHCHQPSLLFKTQMNCNLSREAFPADKDEPFFFGTPIGFHLYLFVPKLYSIHWCYSHVIALLPAGPTTPVSVLSTPVFQKKVSAKAQKVTGRGGRQREVRRGRQGWLAGSLGHSDYPVHLCYTLNVCVCVCVPKIHVLNLNPHVVVLGGGAFRRG